MCWVCAIVKSIVNFKSGAMPTNVTNSAELRTAIQRVVSADPLINVANGPYAVTTLAKLPSYVPDPAVPFVNGYTISGTSQVNTVFTDTRIYQPNIDGPFGPRIIRDLNLNYTSATSNNTAILRTTTGYPASFTIQRVRFTGQHGGWAGNGGVYISLTVSDGNTPANSVNAVNTDLTLQASTISLTNQSGNASFLQSWNNRGTVTIGGSTSTAGNTFNETGLNRGSFHFASMYPGGASGAKLGTYSLRNNTFNGGGTTRDNSNRLENVHATVTSNTFNSGSYLDLAGSLSGITLTGNIFNTIAGGPGIRFTQKSSSLAMLDTTGLQINAATFNGYGMAIVNNDAGIATSSVVKASSPGFNINLPGGIMSISPDDLYAGGRFADTITTTNTMADWINGGDGNDTINAGDLNDWIIGGAGNDTITTGDDGDNILYYDPSEGNDTITDFTAGGGDPDYFSFKRSAFGNLSGLTDAINFVSGSSPVAPTNGPTFLYNTSTGQLTYDFNGFDIGGTSLIATLNGTPSLDSSHFKFF
jgi:Ca2+-binding RTX toxin-like protein